MPMLTVICCTRSQPWGYGHHSMLTYAAENSHKHHWTLDIHVLTLAEQSLGESVMAISLVTPQRLGLSECLEALLPMECVPEISLSLEPALNRGNELWDFLLFWLCPRLRDNNLLNSERGALFPCMRISLCVLCVSMDGTEHRGSTCRPWTASSWPRGPVDDADQHCCCTLLGGPLFHPRW